MATKATGRCSLGVAMVFSCFMALALLGSQVVVSIRVLESTLSLSQETSNISGVKLIETRRVEIEDVTFCIRFNFKLLGGFEGRSRLITIEDWRTDAKDPDFHLLYFGAEYPVSFFGFGYPRAAGSFKSYLLSDPKTNHFDIWASNRWSHVCLAYEKKRGFVKVVKDGEPLNINFEDPEMTKVVIPDDFLSKIYLGRCAFDFKSTCSMTEGQLSDFNVWSRSLSIDELIAWTSCRALEKGDLVNWDTARFELFNVKEVEQPLESICLPLRPGHVLMPEKRNLTHHRQLCRKLKGIVSAVADQKTQDQFNKIVLDHSACVETSAVDGRYWSGWWDQLSEGQFSNVNSAEPLNPGSFQPWYFGEPNGNALENCGIVWTNRNAWNDEKCDVKACGFCELESSPDLRIRGLCPTSKFDTKYSWTRELINGHHSFRGYKDTLLFYDPTSQEWRLELYSDPDIFAVTKSTEYPFGNHLWNISKAHCLDDLNEDGEAVVLNLNACNDDEFNCGDGICVPIEQRCNGKNECPDRTDEESCQIFKPDSTYLKDVPPEPSEGELAEVLITIDVLSILEISEVNSYIQLQLNIKLSWVDNRITMFNLKKDKDVNTLTMELRGQIWIPEIVFFNTQSKEESLNDEKAFVTVERLGNFSVTDDSALSNAHVYQGAENPIAISRTYSFKFTCDFDMAVYPFDTQRCSAIFDMKGNSGKFAKLKIDKMTYLGPIDLTQYFVENYRVEEVVLEPSKHKAIQADMIFGRRLLSVILTTYLPTFLICLMSFSTNYYKGFFFEAIVTVNLTSLLVLTTLFISVSNALPPTAYIKMVDIWLIFCLFIPFSEVILQTWIESLRDEVDEWEYNHHGRSIQIQPRPSDNVGQGGNKEEKIVLGTKIIKVRPEEELKEEEHGGTEANPSIKHQRRNPFAMKLGWVRRMANQGLPCLFALFAISYFFAGILIYKGVVYYDYKMDPKDEK